MYCATRTYTVTNINSQALAPHTYTIIQTIVRFTRANTSKKERKRKKEKNKKKGSKK